jgi:hypothetical protein
MASVTTPLSIVQTVPPGTAQTGSVAAAIRVIVKTVLGEGNLGRILPRSSTRAVEILRGNIASEKGIAPGLRPRERHPTRQLGHGPGWQRRGGHPLRREIDSRGSVRGIPRTLYYNRQRPNGQ